jgi:hypothetical protein
MSDYADRIVTVPSPVERALYYLPAALLRHYSRLAR